ncbi:hypothetical protein UF66_2424 [Staphylococcus cohnii subsp. cohnii]|uniref:Uncharacterized protein n=1 Tax=Staphylococcus cohnii subsp. cohnii TaxID=74704 RepID=A0A0M2NWU6_STACC|nr:hypothetical protein UF66_2424 [Staphylococcus cohnii subsp. cohnii]
MLSFSKVNNIVKKISKRFQHQYVESFAYYARINHFWER